MDKLKNQKAENQFKWTGSNEELKLFLSSELNIMDDEDIHTNNNGSCYVLKLNSLSFNIYNKTKTLQIQGKKEAVDAFKARLLSNLCTDENDDEDEEDEEEANTSPSSTHRNNRIICDLSKRICALENILLSRSSPNEHNKQLLREELEKLGTENNILNAKQLTTESDNKAVHVELERVRTENTILNTRAKALEEERDSLLTVLRIINTESFDRKLSQSSHTKIPPNDNTPSLAEHEQQEYAKQPTAENYNEGFKRNKPIT